MKSAIIIPARLASTRLPRKLLLRETGMTLLQHTYQAALRARRPAEICIAADHEEIAIEARRFGARVIMTSIDCASGTDRVAEAAAQLPDVDVFVNVQGDEPELAGQSIDLAVELLERHADTNMSTLCTPIRARDKLADPSCVKVVFQWVSELGGRALYFSRAAIPHVRDWRDEFLLAEPPCFFQHLGLYAYRRDFLMNLARLPRTPLERLENLEQLRVLESGHSILVGVVQEPSIGIDTPEDYRAFVSRRLAG